MTVDDEIQYTYWTGHDDATVQRSFEEGMIAGRKEMAGKIKPMLFHALEADGISKDEQIEHILVTLEYAIKDKWSR